VPRVGPEILRGIEINPFAAELARTTIWIGDIQWRVKNAVTHHPIPLLRKLDSIECRNALLSLDDQGRYVEASWPPADCVIGNPPFLGANKFKSTLGGVTAALRSVFELNIPQTVDLVAYWIFKASVLLKTHSIRRFGLLATSAIHAGE
jgi:hypothetical protein